MLACGFSLRAAGAAAEPRRAIAIIGETASFPPAAGNVVALAEAQLLEAGDFSFVERDRIEPLLREHQLTALSAPEAGSRRIALGRLLQADVLALLSVPAGPRPHLRVILCETTRGLRLLDLPLALSDSSEKDAAELRDLIRHTAMRAGAPITEIVCVPPFVNNSLTHDADELKWALAKVVERSLLAGGGGVAAVELEEARSIANELELSGGPALQRTLPLYVLGEFRQEKDKLNVSLALKRGEIELGRRDGEDLTETQAVGYLVEAARDLYDRAAAATAQDAPAERFEGTVEGAQLAERGRSFLRIGEWSEATTLLEASLLLMPGDFDVRQDAARAWDRWAATALRKPSRKAAEIDASIPRFRRTLFHLERCFRGRPIEKSHGMGGSFSSFWDEMRLALLTSLDPDVRSRLEPVNTDAVAMLRRVLDAKSAAKVQDDALLVCHPYLSPMERTWGNEPLVPIDPWYADRLELLRRFVHLEEAKVGWLILSMAGVHNMGELHDPRRLAFLQAVQQLPNPAMQAEAKKLYDRAIVLRGADRRLPPATRPITSRRRSAAPATKPAAQSTTRDREPDGEPQVQFELLTLEEIDARGRRAPFDESVEGWVCAGALDLVWTKKSPFLIVSRDQLVQRVALPVKWRSTIQVIYDGRYVWALSRDESAAQLLAYDPATGDVHSFGKDDGLPSSRWGGHLAAMGPGRVCVAGMFGRTWAAVASIDEPGRKSFEIVYEAREPHDRLESQPDDSVDVAFPVTSMASLTDGAAELTDGSADADPAPWQRILLIRLGAIPLLIDPVTKRVEARELGPRRITEMLAHRPGQLDWACSFTRSRDGQTVYRTTLPNFVTREMTTNAPFDAVLIEGEQFIGYDSLHHRIVTAPALTGPFKALRGTPPKKHLFVRALQRTNHFGVVLVEDRLHRLTFSNP